MNFRAPTAAERAWLARAEEVATLGRGAVEPNPRVGAVLLANDQWVAEGAHRAFGGAHAEVMAFAAAEGALHTPDTLIVSLEPCSSSSTAKKTPPCTEAILKRGIRRVIVSALDPDPRHRGAGLMRLAEAGVDVAVDPQGALRFAAANRPFLRQLERTRPHVVLKWAMTLDGRVATASGHSRWITGAAARADVHQRRAHADVVLSGIGTLLADDCRLDARIAGPRVRPAPQRVILDADLRTPSDAAFVRVGDQRAVIYGSSDADATRRAVLHDAGVEIRSVSRGSDGCGVELEEVLTDLYQRGARRVWVEAGPTLAAAFFDQHCVDQVCAYVAPRLLGDGGASGPLAGRVRTRMEEARELEEMSFEAMDSDLRCEGFLYERAMEMPVR